MKKVIKRTESKRDLFQQKSCLLSNIGYSSSIF